MRIASAPNLLNFNVLDGHWWNRPIRIASASLSDTQLTALAKTHTWVPHSSTGL